jgi:hypothetical protein
MSGRVAKNLQELCPQIQGEVYSKRPPLYIERCPALVKSIASFPHIAKSA